MSSENYRSNSPYDSRGNRSGQSPTPHGNDRRNMVVKETVIKSLSTLESTVDKSLSTMSEMTADNTAANKEVSKYAIDKVAAAHSPSTGKKRKHQLLVDDVEIDSRKQARGMEQDIDSGMVRFADQHMSLTTALILWETLTTMSHRVTQKEIDTSDPVIIGHMERFTEQRHALRKVIEASLEAKVASLEAKNAKLEAEVCKLVKLKSDVVKAKDEEVAKL